MNIFMWLFVNDYGSVYLVATVFSILFGILLFIIFSVLFLIFIVILIKETCLPKLIEFFLTLISPIIVLIGWACFIYLIFFTINENFIKSQVTLIPKYGTQTQKEMLAICIQDKRPNGLTEEDKKHVAYIIEDIMLDCQRKYDKLEEKRKQELKHRKFLLKNKEILESLDKMLIKHNVNK